MTCSCHLTIERLKADGLQFARACKVILLDECHRLYLQRSDPQALKQMVEAVMNVEPGIIDEMKRAGRNNPVTERVLEMHDVLTNKLAYVVANKNSYVGVVKRVSESFLELVHPYALDRFDPTPSQVTFCRTPEMHLPLQSVDAICFPDWLTGEKMPWNLVSIPIPEARSTLVDLLGKRVYLVAVRYSYIGVLKDISDDIITLSDAYVTSVDHPESGPDPACDLLRGVGDIRFLKENVDSVSVPGWLKDEKMPWNNA